jgi:hypothetical protein
MKNSPHWVPRALAVLLALGGCYWGFLLSPWLFRTDVSPVSPLALAVFGPGYLVTLCYIIRSISTPPLVVRRLIWVVSILVQGAWLAWDLWGLCEQLAVGRVPNEPLLPTAWWLFATAGSVAGLITERPSEA